MKFIFSYLKKYRVMVVAAMAVKLLGTLSELMVPYVLEHLIDIVAPRKNVTAVFLWGAVMVVLAILARQFNVRANRMAVGVAKESAYEIRRDLFWKTINLSGGQLDEVGLPSLNSRMTSDSYNVQSFIQTGQSMGIRAPILLLGGIAITLTMDVGLALILCIMTPIMIVVIVFVSMKGIPLYEEVQKSLDEVVRIMRENITGIRVVKALSKEGREMNRFGKANVHMTKNDITASSVMALPGPIMTLFLNVGLTLVVVVGAVRVDNGSTQPGVILAFLTYFNMILMGTMALNRVFMLMSKANASADRIAAVIQTEDELTPLAPEEAAVTDRDEFIIFDHVNFSYGQSSEEENSENFDGEGRQKCLENIDFSMKRGGSLGIIGATGCGKTTIINLLMRFYDADEGHIFIDGRDVRTYDKDELHRLFGVVFQNDVVFADSLRENISFGRNIAMQGIEYAAADARAQEFIENYEDAYEHRAAVHGADLSGGQRQRVLIARALAAQPQILVLDDSSSALDYKTDAALRKAIREHYGAATTIIVAQRISSIMNLDDIIVLDEGKIIGHGRHEELMQSCSIYQDIYKTQMGEER